MTTRWWKRIFIQQIARLLLNYFIRPYKTIRMAINPLQTKRSSLYLKTQSVPRCKHFNLGYKNQSVYAVSGTSRCLFSDKYKTHIYSVGRAYSCWMLNCWCITWPVGFKRLREYKLLSITQDKFEDFPQSVCYWTMQCQATMFKQAAVSHILWTAWHFRS